MISLEKRDSMSTRLRGGSEEKPLFPSKVFHIFVFAKLFYIFVFAKLFTSYKKPFNSAFLVFADRPLSISLLRLDGDGFSTF